MTKAEFLNELRGRLAGFPEDDLEERISFYSEMIDDRMEEGVSEEEAVEKAGTPEDVAAQILSEIPLAHLVKEKVKPKRQLKAWEVVLIILGFPLWFPITLSVFVIILALFIVAAAFAVSLYSVVISLALGGIAGIALGAIKIFTGGGIITALCYIGTALIAAGIAILLFILCGQYDHCISAATKKLIQGIKKIFIGKKAD